MGRLGLDAPASLRAFVELLRRDNRVDHRCVGAVPAAVREGKAQLPIFVQSGVTAQVEGLEVQESEQGQQPPVPHLGDFHHLHIGSDRVPALDEQLPGSGDVVLQRRRTLGRCPPRQGEGFRLGAPLPGAQLPDVVDKGGAEQPARCADMGLGFRHDAPIVGSRW